MVDGVLLLNPAKLGSAHEGAGTEHMIPMISSLDTGVFFGADSTESVRLDDYTMIARGLGLEFRQSGIAFKVLEGNHFLFGLVLQ